MGHSVLEARLAMLPFAALLWLVGYSVRFVPIPIKNPLVRLLAQLTAAAIIGGDALGQIVVYRSLSGTRGPLNDDNVFFILLVGEFVIFLCLIFSSAFALRRELQTDHPSHPLDL